MIFVLKLVISEWKKIRDKRWLQKVAEGLQKRTTGKRLLYVVTIF